MKLDRDYFLRRERDHRAMAMAAVNDTARQAHLVLANHHAANLKAVAV